MTTESRPFRDGSMSSNQRFFSDTLAPAHFQRRFLDGIGQFGTEKDVAKVWQNRFSPFPILRQRKNEPPNACFLPIFQFSFQIGSSDREIIKSLKKALKEPPAK